jgi:hypothetical protein
MATTGSAVAWSPNQFGPVMPTRDSRWLIIPFCALNSQPQTTAMATGVDM